MKRSQLITFLKSVIYPNQANEIDAGKHQTLELEILNEVLIISDDIINDETLANSNNVFSAQYSKDNKGPYSTLSVTYLTVDADIPIPANTWIKEINVFVTSGNPTVNIPAINSGDMTDQQLYSNTANLQFTESGSLHIAISNGTVKIQIIKYNI